MSSACGVAELLAGVEDCNVTIAAAVPRRNLFWGMFGIYLVACFTMLHLGCPRRKRRRGARICKKQLPRTHVLCTLKGPRNCRRIGRMRKKPARLLSRNKRAGLFQHRRLYKCMDRFQSFMQRKQCGISKEATDNPDDFDLVSPEDRFSRHRFQGLVLRRMNRRIASSHVDCCFHDGPSWSTRAKWLANLPISGGAAGSASTKRKNANNKERTKIS